VAVLALAALVLAGCGHSSRGKKLSDRELGALVLQPTDLPKTFSEFSFARESSSELSPALHGDRTRFGRQDGWVARYRRGGPTQARGPLTVASGVEVFADSDGAADYLDAVVEAQESAGGALRKVEVSTLGDETAAFAPPGAPPGTAVSFYVVWRDGRFAGGISAVGFARRLVLADVVALARKQEKRMTRAD
jgi:hypothetical protein